MAAQKQAFKRNSIMHSIDKTSTTPLCRLCNLHVCCVATTETVQHALTQFHFSFVIDCGSVQDDALRSPRYPNYYPSNMHCVYWVPIPHGKDLIIYFHDFNLESHSNCT